ncbi:hypothetical protein [Sphingobacterium sp. LRF_L2]|uniref:hypothetical protein n=1 Tax=Sphingobacterium sp. LRF_L2 TaxID=3369421 RepID=UPI003F644ED2
MNSNSCILLSLLFLLTISCQQQSLTKENRDRPKIESTQLSDTLFKQEACFYFAYFNTLKDRILILTDEDTVNSPADFTSCLSGGNNWAPIHFITHKLDNEKDNGTQTAENFVEAPGYLYQVEKKPLTNEAYTLIANDKFIQTRTLKSWQHPSDETTLIENYRKGLGQTEVAGIRLLGKGNDFQLFLTEFKPQQDSASVRLEFISGDKHIVLNQKAAFDSISTWRVDDAGEFGLDYYQLMYVFSNHGNIELVTRHTGVEGDHFVLYREENGRFKITHEAYAYFGSF